MFGCGICLFSDFFFFQALFSQGLFLSWRGHFQELHLKSNLFDSDQNCWIKKRVGELDNSKTFFTESHFRAVAPFFLKANLKMLCNFWTRSNKGKPRHVFLASGFLTCRKMPKSQNTEIVFRCSFHKMIKTFELRFGGTFCYLFSHKINEFFE